MALTVRVITSSGSHYDIKQSSDVALDEAKSVALRELKNLQGIGIGCYSSIVIDARNTVLATLLVTAIMLVEPDDNEGKDYEAAWDMGSGHEETC